MGNGGGGKELAINRSNGRNGGTGAKAGDGIYIGDWEV